MPPSSRPVVHLELHTGDLESACAFYGLVCGWRPERIRSGAGSYLSLDLGPYLGGGIVAGSPERPLWLPYVEVVDVASSTERAHALGASVLLGPREGRYGWRSVVAAEAVGEVAFWQPKACGR
jgi:predicted enzyme related to lactoylglutathione lyase